MENLYDPHKYMFSLQINACALEMDKHYEMEVVLVIMLVVEFGNFRSYSVSITIFFID